MLDPGADRHGEKAPGLSAALGTFAGFALLASTAALCIAIGVPRAPGGLGLRAAHEGRRWRACGRCCGSASSIAGC